MKRYTFTLMIDEGNDEFWESIENVSGCDQLTSLLQLALHDYGFNEDSTKLELVRFQKVPDNIYMSE